MKLYIPIILASVTCLFNSACDSSDPTDIDNKTAIASRLTVPANGDRITFVATSSNPFLSLLEFTGSVTTRSGISYSYEPQGESVFHIEIENSNAVNLSTAIDQTIGEPTALASRFRELLRRDEAVFTVAEIEEIVSILNPSGASLVINTDDPTMLNSLKTRSYRMRITSTEEDKLLGSIGGIYNVVGSSVKVGFRGPTDDEFDKFRFLTSEYKIPFLTTTSNEASVIEEGTFLMELKNVNNAPN